MKQSGDRQRMMAAGIMVCQESTESIVGKPLIAFFV